MKIITYFGEFDILGRATKFLTISTAYGQNVMVFII